MQTKIRFKITQSIFTVGVQEFQPFCSFCEPAAIALSSLFILPENSLIADGTSSEEISAPQLGHFAVKLGILSPQFGHLSTFSKFTRMADEPVGYPHSAQNFVRPFILLPQFTQKTSLFPFLPADFLLPTFAIFLRLSFRLLFLEYICY